MEFVIIGELKGKVVNKCLIIWIFGLGSCRCSYASYGYCLEVPEAWNCIKTRTGKASRGICDHWKVIK